MKTLPFFASTVMGCAACWAQPTPGVVPPTRASQFDKPIEPNATVKRTFKFALKNVKPSLMAYWLDPANHEAPGEIRQFEPLVAVPAGRPNQKGAFSLPKDVDRVVAVDPQNALLVFGTPEAANELAQTINFLDRPLRQVELEGTFIRINSKDLDAIVQNLTPLGGSRMWRVPSNSKTALDGLIKSDKAKVLSSPRILAINNLTADVKETVNEPVQLGDANGTPSALPEGTSLLLETNRSLNVTPTINNDDTVTLSARVGEGIRLKNSTNSDAPLVLQKEDGPLMVVNVHDGETIVIEVHPKKDDADEFANNSGAPDAAHCAPSREVEEQKAASKWKRPFSG